jgi:hypothetical protein
MAAKYFFAFGAGRHSVKVVQLFEGYLHVTYALLL